MSNNRMYNLGVKHGSDKISHHRYHEIFDFYLKPYYNNKGSVLEIGIAGGHSLNMWLELFPKAFIYGIDIHKYPKGRRHQVFEGDQSKEDDLRRIYDQVQNRGLFFINDDGSHIPEHQLLTFNVLFPLLCEGGVYIIEDVETSYWIRGGLYGYETRYGYKHPDSIVEIFKDVIDSINSEFAGERGNRVMHHDHIGSITFSQNCIIIIKKTKIKREYRFKDKIT